MVAEPSDYELGVSTPYVSASIEGGSGPLGGLKSRLVDKAFIRFPSVLEQLAEMGIAPEEVDYVAFDHLHTQDIRRLMGTTAPAPDLGYPDSPIPPDVPQCPLDRPAR